MFKSNHNHLTCVSSITSTEYNSAYLFSIIMILVSSYNNLKTVILRKKILKIDGVNLLQCSIIFYCDFNSLQLDTEHSAKYNNTYNEVIVRRLLLY